MTGTSQQTQSLLLPPVPVIFYAISYFITPAAAGSVIMVLPALVLLFSIGLGAVSYSIFLWFTQKEELGEIRLLIGV